MASARRAVALMLLCYKHLHFKRFFGIKWVYDNQRKTSLGFRGVVQEGSREIVRLGSDQDEFIFVKSVKIIDPDTVAIIQSFDDIREKEVRRLTGSAINSDPDVKKAHLGWQSSTPLPRDLRRFHLPFWNVENR